MTILLQEFISNHSDGVKSALFVCDKNAFYIETWVLNKYCIRSQACGFVLESEEIDKEKLIEKYDLRDDFEIFNVTVKEFSQLSILLGAWASSTNPFDLLMHKFDNWFIWRKWCPAGLCLKGYLGLSIADEEITKIETLYLYNRFYGAEKYGGLL